MKQFLLAILVALPLLRPAEAGAEAARPTRASKVNVALATAGLVLLAGGGAYAYVQDREADRDMRIYRRSAFTENTEAYRERVEDHQKLSWAGLVGAALGGVLFVVSF